MKSSSSIRFFGGLFLLFSAVTLQAQNLSFYVCSNDKSLGIVSWDAADPTNTKNYQGLGTMLYRMSDIALLPDGRLFGISFGGGYAANSALFQIDPNNGGVTLRGDTGFVFNSLTYDTSNNRLLAGGNAIFKSLDLDSGAASGIGDLSGANSAGDLAFLNGTLYLTVNQISSKLYTVNPGSGTAALVGSIGYDSVFGMDTGSNGNLYGFNYDYVRQINAGTGQGSAVFQLSAMGAVDGATAVPEPSILAFFVLALGAVFVSRKMRNRRVLG